MKGSNTYIREYKRLSGFVYFRYWYFWGGVYFNDVWSIHLESKVCVAGGGEGYISIEPKMPGCLHAQVWYGNYRCKDTPQIIPSNCTLIVRLYASQFWPPQSTELITWIERIQRRATKYPKITPRAHRNIQRQTYFFKLVTNPILAWAPWPYLVLQGFK